MSFAASEARTCPIVYVDTANKEVLIWSTHHQAPKVRSQKVTECKKYFITVPENIKENGIFFSPLKAIAYTLINILPFVSFRSTTLGLLEIMLCKTPLQSRCSIFFFFSNLYQWFNSVLVPLQTKSDSTRVHQNTND